jgi:hypothetical protein
MMAAVYDPKAAKVPGAPVESRRRIPAPKTKVVPLQVRWSAGDLKAAKLATIQGDFPTVSDFMLACFHAYMKTIKRA